MSEWIPLIEKMIWPILVLVLVIMFKDKINGLYNVAVEGGRSIEIAGWLKIGEKVQQTEIQKYATGDMSIEAIEGDFTAIEKGGTRTLEILQDKLRNNEIKNIDILKITNNKRYVKDLLLKYVGSLGIKRIIFINDGNFEGWMEGGVFSGQLLSTPEELFSYEQLKNSLAGLKTDRVSPDEKTADVLHKMIESGIQNMAVVDNGQFKYFVNKTDILTSLVTNTILEKQDEE